MAPTKPTFDLINEAEAMLRPVVLTEGEWAVVTEALFRFIYPFPKDHLWMPDMEYVHDHLVAQLHGQEMQVEALGLGNRVAGVLLRMGYRTVGDVMLAGRERLRSLPGCGSTTVAVIGDRLRDFGFALPDYAGHVDLIDDDDA